jgi:hypothetical protein
MADRVANGITPERPMRRMPFRCDVIENHLPDLRSSLCDWLLITTRFLADIIMFDQFQELHVKLIELCSSTTGQRSAIGRNVRNTSSECLERAIRCSPLGL